MRSHRLTFLLSLACVCVAGIVSLPALAGLGDDFGSREPSVCVTRDMPRSGAPSVQQATRYFACDVEHIGDVGENIYLIGDAQLQVVAKGRPYDARTDAGAGIDTDKPVYDLHGSFRLYQCGRKSSVSWQADPGHACRYQEFFDVQGWCWKDRHADWHCALPYKFDIKHTVHGVEPPA